MTDAASSRSALAGSRILLLEDESELREELCQFLTASGLKVEVAADVSEARRLLHGRAFDLVLMDLWLKQESGFDFLRDQLIVEAGNAVMPAGMRNFSFVGFTVDSQPGHRAPPSPMMRRPMTVNPLKNR